MEAYAARRIVKRAITSFQRDMSHIAPGVSQGAC